jgi:hypothetical protein
MAEVRSAPARAAELGERRRAQRFANGRIELLLESAVFFETVLLVDIGRSGFCVKTPVTYPTGTAIKLHLPGFGAHEAQAVWYAQGKLGARFAEPLPEQILVILNGED